MTIKLNLISLFVFGLVFMAMALYILTSSMQGTMENEESFASYLKRRDANCTRCIAEQFGVNLTPGDWGNVSPFMAEVCGDCKPVVMV